MTGMSRRRKKPALRRVPAPLCGVAELWRSTPVPEFSSTVSLAMRLDRLTNRDRNLQPGFDPWLEVLHSMAMAAVNIASPGTDLLRAHSDSRA